MYVAATLKCPDKDEWIALVSIDAEGNTEIKGYTTAEDLGSAIPLLRDAVALAEEHGHPSAATVERWSYLLHTLAMVAKFPSD